MEVSFVLLLSHIQLGWWDEEDTPTLHPPTMMCDVEDPPYNTPYWSSAVDSWNDVQWGGPTLSYPPLGISSWELKWHVQWGGPTYPTPYWSSAVESWSGMCNEEDPPTLPPIGHQQLRVKMTCAMRRTHPTQAPIGHQQLHVEVTCAMRRSHPTLPLLAIIIWELKWHVQWGGHTLPNPPLVISSWELKWHVQWGGHTLPYPPFVISSWELKWHVQWGGPALPYPLLVIQQLRVEVTSAMRRTHSTLPLLVISSWELKWHVQWGEPTYPTPYWSSAVES